MKRAFKVTALLAVMTIAPLSAQPDDREEILDLIRVMFDGLKAQDTARMRSTLHDGTRFVLTTTRDGAPSVNVVPLDAFLSAVAGATNAIEERYWNPQVVIHDNLASVWVEYDFYVNGQVDHCGEDNFQLARFSSGWKIVAVADTQRRNCPSG